MNFCAAAQNAKTDSFNLVVTCSLNLSEQTAHMLPPAVRPQRLYKYFSLSSLFFNLLEEKQFPCSFIWELSYLVKMRSFTRSVHVWAHIWLSVGCDELALSHKSPGWRVYSSVTGSYRGKAFTLSDTLFLSLIPVNTLIVSRLKVAVLTVCLCLNPTQCLPFHLVFYVVLYECGQLWDELWFVSCNDLA